jgi:hypothetical protein
VPFLAGLLAFVFFTAWTSTIAAADDVGDSYDCSSDMVGGLTFDQQSKQWGPARLSDMLKFVLRLTSVAKTDEVGARLFKVTITYEASNDPVPCWTSYGYKGSPEEVPMLASDNMLRCITFAKSYRFNVQTNRFLAANLEGFVDGDGLGDTPYLAIGKCTKIN